MTSHHTDKTTGRTSTTTGAAAGHTAAAPAEPHEPAPVPADTPVYDAMVHALTRTQPVTGPTADSHAAHATENTTDPRGPRTGVDDPVSEWIDHQYGRPSTPPLIVDPDSPEGAAILSLYRRIKDIEHCDGSWPGADVVDEITTWLVELGINPDQSWTDARHTLRTALGEHPGQGLHTTVHGVRIRTHHHQPEALIRAALHTLTCQLGAGTSVELLSRDHALIARTEYRPAH